MGEFWWTEVNIYFVSSLALEWFSQQILRWILCPPWHGIGLFNTCWDAFCLLSDMGRVWSIHVDLYLLAWDGISHNILRWILGPRFRGRLQSIQVDIHCVLPGMRCFCQQKFKYISSHCWHGRGLIKTIWDTHSVIDEMGWVWSTHIEIHFVFSLAWAGFGLSELSYIFCPRWHGMGLVNARQDIFWVRAGMEGQHMLWYILCPRWHGSVLVNNAAMNFVSTHPILGMT